MKRVTLALTAMLLSTMGLAAQQQSPQNSSAQAAAPAVRSATQEVLLDMVFRDKKGRTIHDIKPEEIHISEDGVEQKLTSFRAVEGKESGTSSAPGAAVEGAAPSLDPMREVRLVSLVFEGLDQEGRRFFRQTLKDVLDMAPEQNLYFSVLTIDQRLQVLQPFTSDHNALLKIVDKSSMWSFVQYETQSSHVKAELQQTLSQGEPTLQGTTGASGGGPSASQIQGAVNYRMAKMQYDMLQAAEAADREYNARATIDALLALVKAEAQLPGRKVILYFNPGLFIPETVKEQYANMISAANRANVSFYTVDPQGLVALSDSAGSRTGAVTWSSADQARGQLSGAMSAPLQVGGGAPTPDARAAENAESALRANPLLWLRDLAQQTGGTAIAETNDYRAPLRTVMDEVRTYYEAAYTPHIEVYDGKFRKISVRVDRPDVVVHTRSGYFALPQLKGGQQLYAYEMPLLNALNSASPPTDVVFRAAADRFDDRGPKVEYMVTLEAPLKGLDFQLQADKKNSGVDAGLLAVLKNSSGEIVEKFSKDFAVEVALDKVDAYKAGNLVQTFRTELLPGDYELEAVIMDRNGNRLGVQKTKINVPPPSNKLSMSDVVVVRRTDALKDTGPVQDAFYFPGGKVVPTLNDTLKGGPGNILPFYFAVYPDRTLKDPLKLTMAFYKEGQYLGAAEAPLPEALPDGRIPYIANLPADKFTPGAYEIHIGITQGNAKAEEKVAFQVN
ncbi:MAG TPA: VWA domain-containing protein [Candidatus Acidoferrum sp.]|nr:VWA domain-containing protein [Candidatus Acidoferrum sp.]